MRARCPSELFLTLAFTSGQGLEASSWALASVVILWSFCIGKVCSLALMNETSPESIDDTLGGFAREPDHGRFWNDGA